MERNETLIFNLTVSQLQSLIDNSVKKGLEKLNLQDLNPLSPAKDIINLDEVCELANLAKPTIYGLVNNRKIPYFKQGKKLRFKKSELIAWIEKGRRKTIDEIEEEADGYLQNGSR